MPFYINGPKEIKVENENISSFYFILIKIFFNPLSSLLFINYFLPWRLGGGGNVKGAVNLANLTGTKRLLMLTFISSPRPGRSIVHPRALKNVTNFVGVIASNSATLVALTRKESNWRRTARMYKMALSLRVLGSLCLALPRKAAEEF